MVILDVSIVNVALPSIHDGLHFSTTGLQWVVNAYTLTFAGLLMLGGRCADLLGRRRVFLFGTALFSLSSLPARSPTRADCCSARARCRVSAGRSSRPPRSRSSRAPSPRDPNATAPSACGARWARSAPPPARCSAALLTQAFGWPAIFAVNVPLGAVVIAFGTRVIPASRAEGTARATSTSPGAVLVTASLVSLTFGIVRTDTLGWGSPGVLGPLAAGVALLAAFVFVEARVAEVPLVPLSVFRSAQLRVANLVVTLLYGAVLPGLVLPDALPAAGPALRRDRGRPLVPADDPVDLRRLHARAAAGRPVRRRAGDHGGMLSPPPESALLVGVAPGGSYLAHGPPRRLLSAIGMGLSLVPATIVAMQ